MNARWQGYVELREKYICALEQRCSDLKAHHQRQQLTEEQQRQIDELLLQQHRKTELAVEARLKVRNEHTVVNYFSHPNSNQSIVNHLPASD